MSICLSAYLSILVFAGSMGAVKLESIITKTSLLKDVRQLSPQHQTFSLDAFHSLILHFAPKHTGFSYLGMYSRSVLCNGITMLYFSIHTPDFCFKGFLKCVILQASLNSTTTSMQTKRQHEEVMVQSNIACDIHVSEKVLLQCVPSNRRPHTVSSVMQFYHILTWRTRHL